MQTKISCPHCGNPDLIVDLGDTTDFGPLEVDDEHRLHQMQAARQRFIGQSVMAAVVHHTVLGNCPAINPRDDEDCGAHSHLRRHDLLVRLATAPRRTQRIGHLPHQPIRSGLQHLGGNTMSKLIDFHTNCNCGADVHAYLAAINDETLGAALQLRVATTGSLVEQRVPLADIGDGLVPTPASDVVKQGVPGPDLLAPALETMNKLMASAAWLVEQAEAGEGIDLDEVRQRFGLDQGDTQPDDTAAPPAAKRGRRASTTPVA